ncbi:MAG: polysaccharide biosynthesis tyrosine autokinase [Desulfobacterales bacterium]
MGKISDALQKSLADESPAERTATYQNEMPNREEQRPLGAAPRKPKSVSNKEPQGQRLKLDTPGQSIRPEVYDKAYAPAETEKPAYHSEFIASSLIAYNAPDSYEAEQFRMLRTNLLFPKDGRLARNIMIASTAPSEGKTFVAANLAISIAQNIDKHVLLIDCDIRKPSIHKLFGYGQIPGLSDYLAQGRPLTSLLRKTFLKRLSILPGGPAPSNPAELLSSGRMADLLKEVTQRYSDRFIIIDTPPIQLTAESRALAKFVDGILLVVRFGSSNKIVASEAINTIGKDKWIGVVGNFVDKRAISDGYTDKYSSIYRQSP